MSGLIGSRDWFTLLRRRKEPDVPRHSFCSTVTHTVCRFKPKQAPCLAYVGLRVTDITWPEIPVVRLGLRRYTDTAESGTQGGMQFVEVEAVPDRHIVNLALRFLIRECRANVRLNRVVDVAEVAAGLAITVDHHGVSRQQSRCPLRDHRSVSTVGVLPAAKHVEIAQPRRAEAIRSLKNIRVKFVDVFRDGIGRQRIAYPFFNLWQRLMIAIGGRRSGVNETRDIRIACRDQNI